MKIHLVGKDRFADAGLTLLLFGLVFAERDAYGVSNFFSSFIPGFYQAYVGFFLFLYLASLVRLYNKRNEIRSIVKWGVWGANFIVLAIFFSEFFKSLNVLRSISYALYDGFVIFVIWVSIFRDERGTRFLIAYIFVQMTLSVLVILNPDLYFIDGKYYQDLQGRFTIDSSASDGFALDKTLVGAFGVLHNPNALGFYSATAVVCGVYLIFSGKRLSLLLGWMLVFMGVYGWTNSLTRGPVIALLAGAAFIYLLGSLKSGVLSLVLRVFLGCVAAVVVYSLVGDLFEYLIPSGDNVSVSGRFDGYIDGWRAFEMHPLIGVDNDDYWRDRNIPHLLPLYLMASHGFLAGVLASLLLFGVAMVVIIRSAWIYSRYAGEWPNLKLSIALMLVCVAVALTNNITSPFLFWAAFAQAAINYSRASREVARKHVC